MYAWLLLMKEFNRIQTFSDARRRIWVGKKKHCGFSQPPHSSMILEAVAAPLTGGMQILKVGKMVSLVGADEETFKRVPWIAPAWYGITAEVSWSI
jgi:hypothetical protein